MKRIIVADKSGRITATGPHPDDFPEAEGKFRFIPLKGQHVHEVQLPRHINSMDHIRELRETHQIKVQGGVAKLVERVTKRK